MEKCLRSQLCDFRRTCVAIAIEMNPESTSLIILLGAGYTLLFWSLSWKIPALPLIIIFGLAPFQNDMSGGGWLHFSLSEVHLLLSAPLLALRGWRGSLSWMSGMLWSALALAALITIPNWRETSAVSLIQMGLYWIGAVAVFATIPQRKGDWEIALRALVVVGVLLAVAALAARSNYIWGLHKNGVGASLACALVVTVECWTVAVGRSRLKYVAALAIISGGLVVGLSRGAWLSALVGVVFLLAWRGQYRRMAQLGALLVPLVLSIWMLLPEDSKDYALSFDPERHNIKARRLNTEWVREQWACSPFWGVGVGLRKEYDATNVLWLTLAETGPLGVVALLGMHLRLIHGLWIRRPLLGKGTNSVSSVALAGGLVLGKLAHGMVDHYWSRGALMIAWAMVGMALSPTSNLSTSTSAFFSLHQRKLIYSKIKNNQNV